MSSVDEIIDVIAPLAPVLKTMSDSAAASFGENLPATLVKAFALLRRRYASKPVTLDQVRSDLENDRTFRQDLASTLNLHMQTRQINTFGTNQSFGSISIENGDFIVGNKNDFRGP